MLTEIWIEHPKECEYLKMYDSEFFIREGRGGGIGIYIHKNCKYTRRDDIISIEECESLSLEPESDKYNGKYILGAIYIDPLLPTQTFLYYIVFSLSSVRRHQRSYMY